MVLDEKMCKNQLYLNERETPDRYVIWKFIQHLDVYETDIAEIDPNGTEVFDKTKNRRLKKSGKKQ